MQKRFFEILTNIAFGLQQKKLNYERKVSQDDEYVYFQQNELTYAIQELALFMLECGIFDSYGTPIAPQNETEAIIHYFSKTLDEWPCAQHSLFNEFLSIQEDEDRLIYLNSNKNHFEITQWCEELASESKKFNMDAMQNLAFAELMSVSENQYVFLRKFLIEHPILDFLHKMKFLDNGQKLGLEKEFLDDFIQIAYEEIPNNIVGICSFCQWTVMHSSTEKRCIDRRCINMTNNFSSIVELKNKDMSLRLKPGVMKYMALPGKDELELFNFCEKNNYQSFLWPDNDRYDLKIKINNLTYAVDVKSYYSPYLLANHIENKGIFNRLNNDEIPVLLIPNHRVQKKGYISIVQNALPNTSIKCMTINEFKTLLRQEEKCIE